MLEHGRAKIGDSFLRYASSVIALGGFLFGYDTGVINGALSFLSQPNQLNLNSAQQGIVSSSLIIGCCFGALLSGRLADKIGRKAALQWVAVVFTVATLGCSLSTTSNMLIAFRTILGLSVGCASDLAPMYLAEISPREQRSRNVNKNAIAIVIGQLASFTVNAILGNVWGNWGPIWRIMMGVAALPAFLLWLLSFDLPQSPKWQLLNTSLAQAKQNFKKLGFSGIDIRKNLINTKKIVQTEESKIDIKRIFNNKYLVYLLAVGISIGLIQQLSGVNAIMYYGTILLEKVGMSREMSLYSNILVGVISTVATLLGTRLIVNHNHREMLGIGLLGNAFFLGLLTAVLHFNFFSGVNTNIAVLLLLAFFLATQQGIVSPVTWLMLSEIFPQRLKARFMAVSTTVIWLTNFVISLVCPILLGSFGTTNVFLLFTISNILCVCLTFFFINPQAMRNALKRVK
ncbi:major facilitator superfamily permease [Liquorilactobacillus aquaticus DSM 21051]|uniref:Major facilitator superfamily permease n=1 Tax=Liquorilactobacillus aquaticus DSM 21051 TaxID=1423725 RepID=A0A0R2D840_9LACO|nr:major facilitator superfamily permease [Liquorilactobacillus aquaticus DSM 21051]